MQGSGTATERTQRHHATLAADLAETGGPFPERLHVNALVFEFMWQQAEMLLRWVKRAEDEVAHWPEDASQPIDRDVVAVLREAAVSST